MTRLPLPESEIAVAEYVKVTDGTDTLAIDTNGYITEASITPCITTSGANLPASLIQIGGSDGTKLRPLALTETYFAVKTSIRSSNNLEPTIASPNADGTLVAQNAIYSTAPSYELNGTTFDRVRHSQYQATAGIVANAAGTAIDLTTTPMSKFTTVVLRTAGSSAWVADLQGSLDGTNYFQVDDIGGNAASAAFYSDAIAMRYIRYNITTIGSGNTLTIQILCSAR